MGTIEAIIPTQTLQLRPNNLDATLGSCTADRRWLALRATPRHAYGFQSIDSLPLQLLYMSSFHQPLHHKLLSYPHFFLKASLGKPRSSTCWSADGQTRMLLCIYAVIYTCSDTRFHIKMHACILCIYCLYVLGPNIGPVPRKDQKLPKAQKTSSSDM